MGSYIRPLLFGWQHFILYEKHCFCIPELKENGRDISKIKRYRITTMNGKK